MFLLVNQNIDAQLYTHVKNHHHNMNYLNLGDSILFFIKNSLKKALEFIFIFLKPKPRMRPFNLAII